MQHDHSLKSVTEITERLRNMECKNFPQAEIDAERDFILEKTFGINRSELVSPLPRTEIERLKNLCYLDVEEIAEQHGFNIEAGRGEFASSAPLAGEPAEPSGRDEYVRLVYLADEDEDEDEDEDSIEDDGDYYYGDDDDDEEIPEFECATKHYLMFIEMMRAKELGLFPTTPEQLRELQEARAAKKFAEQRERERRRTQNHDLERERVFGTSREFRPGTTSATVRKGARPGPARQVTVEIVNRRRPKS